jgi:hypothetical protein
MGRSISDKRPRKKLTLIAAATAASAAAALAVAASSAPLVSPKPRGRGRPPKKTKKNRTSKTETIEEKQYLNWPQLLIHHHLDLLLVPPFLHVYLRHHYHLYHHR